MNSGHSSLLNELFNISLSQLPLCKPPNDTDHYLQNEHQQKASFITSFKILLLQTSLPPVGGTRDLQQITFPLKKAPPDCSGPCSMLQQVLSSPKHETGASADSYFFPICRKQSCTYFLKGSCVNIFCLRGMKCDMVSFYFKRHLFSEFNFCHIENTFMKGF